MWRKEMSAVRVKVRLQHTFQRCSFFQFYKMTTSTFIFNFTLCCLPNWLSKLQDSMLNWGEIGYTFGKWNDKKQKFTFARVFLWSVKSFFHLTQERENEKQKKVNKYADDLVVYVKEHVKVCKTENNAFSVEIWNVLIFYGSKLRKLSEKTFQLETFSQWVIPLSESTGTDIAGAPPMHISKYTRLRS